jgi:serine/threonine protein kinase
MLGGRNISEGYIGLTMDVYNKDDNIDLYNLIKKDNPKEIILYGIDKKYLLAEKLDYILKEIKGKSNFIVKKIKKGDLIMGLAAKNFNNEFNSVKDIYSFMGNKIKKYTTIKPLFNYNDIDIYALSYNKKYYLFQEKCMNTIDNLKFTQNEFDKMINDINEEILLLQKHKFLHNDIKPDNIILCKGKYKLIDWDRAYYYKKLFKTLYMRGYFLFNHPYKFYKKGIPLFIYNFFVYLFKYLDNKKMSWIFDLNIYKQMEEKIYNSANYLIHNKKLNNNLSKYYDNYSFALVIIYLSEKNNLKMPTDFVNNLLKPFHISI